MPFWGGGKQDKPFCHAPSFYFKKSSVKLKWGYLSGVSARVKAGIVVRRVSIRSELP